MLFDQRSPANVIGGPGEPEIQTSQLIDKIGQGADSVKIFCTNKVKVSGILNLLFICLNDYSYKGEMWTVCSFQVEHSR